MDDEAAVRQRMYLEYRKELRDRESSNSESFDRSVLSLSSAALGFSISFIKDVVPLGTATHIFLLHTSWVLFAAAIVATMASLISSQCAIERQLIWAHEYYLERKEEFGSKRNPFDRVTIWLNRLSGLIFIVGVGLTVAFAVLNTPGGEGMGKDDGTVVKGQPVGAMIRVPHNQEQHGQTVGNMPKVPSGGGAQHQQGSTTGTSTTPSGSTGGKQ